METENDLFQQILEDHQELSSLPATLAEVLRVSQDDDSAPNDLVDVLKRDPALTAKTLRLANSPFFGAGREISSMLQAVMTLGVKSVTALALSTSVYDLTGKWASTIDRTRFWRHSLCVAIAARNLAELAGHKNSEEAFVAGLLHDIGLLVLESSFPDKYERIWSSAEAGDRIDHIEAGIWGTNHARVGQFLLQQWKLPAAICDAVGSHHNDQPANPDDAPARLSQVVALANLTAHFTVARAHPRPASSLEQIETLATNLGLESDDLRRNSEVMLKQTAEESRFLDLDIGSTSELLTEANSLLFEQYLVVEKLLREKRTMQEQIAKGEIEKAALDTLKAITATFNHYVNNAVGTILGRAQLVQTDIKRGTLVDHNNTAAHSMEVIIKGVDTIQSVMNELLDLSSFDTTVYYDDALIIDIEKKIEEQLASIDETTSAVS